MPNEAARSLLDVVVLDSLVLAVVVLVFWAGVFVARSHRENVDTPIVCLETALPVKFAPTIREAIGRDPDVPERFAEILNADRHVTDLPNDVDVVKEFITTSISNSSVGR